LGLIVAQSVHEPPITGNPTGILEDSARALGTLLAVYNCFPNLS